MSAVAQGHSGQPFPPPPRYPRPLTSFPAPPPHPSAYIRYSEHGKAELHMLVEDMQERLWALSDDKRQSAERLLASMAEDGWLAAHALQVTISYLSLCQSEADRFVKTSGLLHNFCSIRSHQVPPAPAL